MFNFLEFCNCIIVMLLIKSLHEHKPGYQYKNNFKFLVCGSKNNPALLY